MGTDEKRRTLIFPPALDRPARATTRDADRVDESWDAIEVAAAPLLSSSLVIPDEDDERPSGRTTIPAPAATTVDDAPRQSALRVPRPRPRGEREDAAPTTLRGHDLEAREATTRPPPPIDTVRPSLHDLALALEASTDPLLDARTPTSLPPISIDVRPPMTSAPAEIPARSVPVPSFPSARTAALFAGSNLAVGLLVLGTVYALRPEPSLAKRSPRLVVEDRVTLGSDVGAAEDLAPIDGCRVQDLDRVVARRVELGPGLDASALESGFGVGLASNANEAVGLRLDASSLRTAETIRLRTPWPFAHVTVDAGRDPDARLEVHVDGIFAHKGGVFARDGRLMWGLPGPASKWNEPVRAAVRTDGSSVVAVRRPAHFWVGVEGHGPMTSIVRAHRQVGMPSVTPTNEGGVIAWAERGAGPSTIVASTITADGSRTRTGAPVTIAEGTSPAVAALPSGELLLTYVDNAHRVVAQRLGSDLDPRGELLVVSGDAGVDLPAVAVDAEGRALIAYVAITPENSGRAREVRATELRCR